MVIWICSLVVESAHGFNSQYGKNQSIDQSYFSLHLDYGQKQDDEACKILQTFILMSWIWKVKMLFSLACAACMLIIPVCFLLKMSKNNVNTK